MESNEIRRVFIDYFHKQGHEVVSSSSLIPAQDPTLLFTNAGMVQFKDVFLGEEQRPYQRATSIQRCLRAGGKHNDLENVGYTKRHHTFFEMLGNFSFGDYFKREAIQFAWHFLTQELNLSPEKLWVTVFHEDPESEEIWLKEMKIDPNRFSRCGKKDNFWSMGDIGPCGPCTEIFYDHGPSLSGHPPGSKHPEGDRFVEIWNLVFMQYDRDLQGQLRPLPKPCVDTGMGLERIAAVMQGVHDNFEIDIFIHLLNALSQLTGCEDYQSVSMRVIVDHIRAASFLIADGVSPSNEGRGYVLRRIIRRAVRHGFKLGQQKPFFHCLVPALIKTMGTNYPELIQAKELVEQLIEQEELQFSSTLETGLKVFDDLTAKLSSKVISGETVFQLYDTYGFPVDLTADLAKERNLEVDHVGFNQAMARQRKQSQQTHQFKPLRTQQLHITVATEFSGYDQLTDTGSVVTLLYNDKPISSLEAGQRGVVVLSRTPFYAESGGQVGDKGYLYFDGGYFKVNDTQKLGQAYLHYGELLKGKLQINDSVRAEVDESRHDIILNHSATHLLHEALRRILGTHVIQKGSLVEARKLRFDFSHPKPLTTEEIQAVERLINQQIRNNKQTSVQLSNIEDAKKQGALALFGEKYDKEIRVVEMGEFSKEVCGGTHVAHTGDIGLFKIVSETACAAGIRRIEAVTGQTAIQLMEENEEILQKIKTLLKVNPIEIVSKLEQLLIDQRTLEKELNTLKQQLANQQSNLLATQAVSIGTVKILAAELKKADPETLRASVDQLKQQLGSAAIILATTTEKQEVRLVAGVTKDCLPLLTAPELLTHVAHQIGGFGGGRPDLAQGGGNQPALLSQALSSVIPWAEAKLQK